MKNSLNFLLFLLLALLWSGSFINIKIAVEVFPPIFSALIRVVIAFICLTLLFLSQRKNLRIPVSEGWRLWITGIFTQALPFGLLFYGEKFISPALASILNSTVSIWALLLGSLFFLDFSQWTQRKVLGLIIGFAGVLFIFWPMLSAHGNSLIGTLSILIMAIAYAIGGLLTQHLVFAKMKTTFQINLWHQHLASVVCLTFASLYLEHWPSLNQFFHLKTLIALLYLGIFATAIAWMLYFHLIKEWGAVRATSVMYIVPILAILWDFLFLHSIPTWNQCIGAMAILGGVIMIQWMSQKKR